jgi:hypothetical protein
MCYLHFLAFQIRASVATAMLEYHLLPILTPLFRSTATSHITLLHLLHILYHTYIYHDTIVDMIINNNEIVTYLVYTCMNGNIYAKQVEHHTCMSILILASLCQKKPTFTTQ